MDYTLRFQAKDSHDQLLGTCVYEITRLMPITSWTWSIGFFFKDLLGTFGQIINPHTVVKKLHPNPVLRGPHGPRQLF